MKQSLILSSLISLFFALPAGAENILSGKFDFYTQWSPQAHSANTPTGPGVLEGRVFDRQNNQMILNMALFSVSKKIDKVALKMDLGFGEMVDQLSGGQAAASQEPSRNILQALVSYSVSERLLVTAGKFNSYLGYEVTSAQDNFQYSRSYLYNYGIPFWHQGLSVSYVIEPQKWTSTLYVLNAWEGRTSQEANKSWSLGANFNYVGSDGFVGNYNYLGGVEDSNGGRRQVHELNGLYSLSPALQIAIDFIYGEQTEVATVSVARWNALAMYLKYTANDFYSFSPRFEIFDDSDQGFALVGALSSATPVKQKISALTVTNNFTLSPGLDLRAELRFDKSDSDLYFKNSSGQDVDHQESFNFALLYSF